MLGSEERKLMYRLAKGDLTGSGAVVDLGAFCGASASIFCEGLNRNARCAGVKVHSYDRFIADDPFTVSGTGLARGESFEHLFRAATAPYLDRIVIHAGDVMEQFWPADELIELLFVDVAKTIPLSGHILTQFFPALRPGSIVIHQDFYHPYTFWLAVQMEALSAYFSVIKVRKDWSIAFRLDRPIPANVLAEVAAYPYLYEDEIASIDRLEARLGEQAWPLKMVRCGATGARRGAGAIVTPSISASDRRDAIFPASAAELKERFAVDV
jgi:predicted O-methyltransferase YrrM